MRTFYIGQFDNRPTLEDQLMNGLVPLDLSNAADVWLQVAGNGRALLGRPAAILEPRSAGQVQFAFTSADTAQHGRYAYKWLVRWADGAVQHDPTNADGVLVITRSPAPNPTDPLPPAPIAPFSSPLVLGVTRYVDPVRGDDANAGTTGQAPYATIGRALQDATGFGDVIVLASGRLFAENITISVPGLCVLAATPGRAPIIAPATGVAVTLNADGVILDTLRLQSRTGDALVIAGDRARVKHVDSAAPNGSAIHLRPDPDGTGLGAVDVEIEDVLLHDSAAGLTFRAVLGGSPLRPRIRRPVYARNLVDQLTVAESGSDQMPFRDGLIEDAEHLTPDSASYAAMTDGYLSTGTIVRASVNTRGLTASQYRLPAGIRAVGCEDGDGPVTIASW